MHRFQTIANFVFDFKRIRASYKVKPDVLHRAVKVLQQRGTSHMFYKFDFIIYNISDEAFTVESNIRQNSIYFMGLF